MIRPQAFQHPGLGDDGKILLLIVPRDEQAPDTFHHGLDERGVGYRDVDLVQAQVIEEPPGLSHWDERGVVNVEPEELALRFHHPEHQEALAGDAHVLAEGSLIPEEFVL